MTQFSKGITLYALCWQFGWGCLIFSSQKPSVQWWDKTQKASFQFGFFVCVVHSREAAALVTMTHFQRCPRLATANERHANLQAFFSSLKKILKAGNDGWKSHFWPKCATKTSQLPHLASFSFNNSPKIGLKRGWFRMYFKYYTDVYSKVRNISRMQALLISTLYRLLCSAFKKGRLQK